MLIIITLCQSLASLSAGSENLLLPKFLKKSFTRKAQEREDLRKYRNANQVSKTTKTTN